MKIRGLKIDIYRPTIADEAMIGNGEFKTVPQIEKSKSGKLRFIISDIKERDGVDSGK